MPFLTNAQLAEFTKDISFDHIELMSQDNYDEEKVAATIEKTGKKAELMSAAINMAIVGYGNQKYGQVKYKDTIYDMADLFHKTGVKTKLIKSAIVGDGDLTPNRLCRFFRIQIREYIIKTHSISYMSKKYSNGDDAYAMICFRGAEYLDLSKDQIDYLKKVFSDMDEKLNLNLVEKLKRVQEAKARNG
jgi:hypothetical protein